MHNLVNIYNTSLKKIKSLGVEYPQQHRHKNNNIRRKKRFTETNNRENYDDYIFLQINSWDGKIKEFAHGAASNMIIIIIIIIIIFE